MFKPDPNSPAQQQSPKQQQSQTPRAPNSTRPRPSSQFLATPLRHAAGPRLPRLAQGFTDWSPSGRSWCSEEELWLVSGSRPGRRAPRGSGGFGAAVQMSQLGPCVPRPALPVAQVAGVRGSEPGLLGQSRGSGAASRASTGLRARRPANGSPELWGGWCFQI